MIPTLSCTSEQEGGPPQPLPPSSARSSLFLMPCLYPMSLLNALPPRAPPSRLLVPPAPLSHTVASESFLVFWLWPSSVPVVGHCFILLSAPNLSGTPGMHRTKPPLGFRDPPQGLTLATFTGKSPSLSCPHALCQPHQMLPQLNQCLLEGPRRGMRGRAVSCRQAPPVPFSGPPLLPLQLQCHLGPLLPSATPSHKPCLEPVTPSRFSSGSLDLPLSQPVPMDGSGLFALSLPVSDQAATFCRPGLCASSLEPRGLSPLL